MALNGIDVSGWQSTIDISRVPCDFVIAKATGGTKLVSSACDKQIQAAKKAGKLWGFYHFAREKGYGASTAEAEAKYFVKNCKNYFGSGVPVLDFEQDVAVCGVSWAKNFLDTVYKLTGVRPLIYMSLSVVRAYNWAPVAKNYGLWVAAYPSNRATGYTAATAPACGAWGTPAIYQYSSHGKLTGYSGYLDLNRFYGDKTAWNKYAGVTAAKTAAKTAESKTTGNSTNTTGKLKIDGILGAKTVKALQKFLGVPADGVAGKTTIKALQKFLNSKLG
jgi:lysozyme